ncbi:hypothetical protein BU16DRAFT_562609 [Lophium mytilinum]|uniref:F-box domain-containing protein n=1 Tax=Lophium mytilinum TaxID=390894 RepID=A0A6A6QR69_9PEZI|nr:hypothetical protein BU16DRAFT_562609 [Lophium mytilinum]
MPTPQPPAMGAPIPPDEGSSLGRKGVTPRSSLDSLPEELLANICSFLPPPDTANPSPVAGVCRVSRKFHRISLPYLYRHVHKQSGCRGASLIRTLRENPDLAKIVTVISTDPADSHHHWKEDEEVRVDHAQMPDLLQLLPSLEKLDLQGFCEGFSREYGLISRGSEWLHIEQGFLPKLREVSLDFRSLVNHYDLAFSLQLPTIKVVNLVNESISLSMLSRSPPANYNVETLKLTDFGGWTLVREDELVQSFKSLKNFSIQYERVFKRFQFKTLLEEQQESLEQLEVIISKTWYHDDLAFYKCRGGVSGMAGLDRFTNLSSLRADYLSLAGLGPDALPISQLPMPPNLRRLRIDVRGAGIITLQAELRDLAVLRCRLGELPSLTSVIVATDNQGSSKMVKELEELFGESSVKFEQINQA